MIFKIPLADRKAIETYLREAVAYEVTNTKGFWDLIPDEVYARERALMDEVREFLKQWFEEGEFLTVKIDTEAGTCEIVRVDG